MRDMNQNVMAWTLSSGLRHLKDLVNLRWLEFYDEDLPASIGIPELMFMKQHWHNLQSLASRHATDLPELRQRVARYLDLATLKSCSLVCKAWNLDFHSILWERFACTAPERCSESPEEYATWIDIISRKAYLFQHIYHRESRNGIAPDIRDILLDRCDGLITIEAFTGVEDLNPIWYWQQTLRPLIERNKFSLRRLQLRGVASIPMTSLQLPNLFAGLPRLQTLDLGMAFTTEYLLPVLDACSTSLECLELRSDILRKMANQEDSAVDQPSSPVQSIIHQEAITAPSLRLKHLSIHGACYDGALWDILSRLAGHSLESLVVNTITNSQFSSHMPPTLGDALSRLTNLHINRLRVNYNSGFLVLLKAIPPHQLRRVYLGNMDTQCAVTLSQQHHRSLESLGVIFLRGHSGSLADILATCHKLKTLDFGGVPLTDIRTLIDPQRPWVCTELEAFEGYFGLSPPLVSNDDHGADDSKHEDSEEDEKSATSNPVASNQVENIFMQRLGQLTKLRRLVRVYDAMGYIFSGYPTIVDKDIMAWTLSSGLRHLADLVNLEWLEFYDLDLPAGIGIPELVFIKQHWPSLKGLSCYNMNAIEVQEWLASEWPELEVKLEHGY
ncbi:hypothetical protein BGX34_002588 [Mortierella sp. NVP85]|nr:hypothetical protein BGX34_002588 [Mortierella sp. NVP85]